MNEEGVLKILNLYAGIGGNRKLWTPNGNEHEITAVELDPKIAEIYKDFFPKDNVIVADAHQYLLEHFKEFDFIWSSPPCPTHSPTREWGTKIGQVKAKYPDMQLYEEVILLKTFAKCKWVVENVISYYEPLIRPFERGGHYYWTNFFIGEFNPGKREHHGTLEKIQERKGFDLSKYHNIDKTKILRNCVEPETGLHILNESIIDYQKELFRDK